jgi:ABC-type sugar transport system ATPase subunit
MMPNPYGAEVLDDPTSEPVLVFREVTKSFGPTIAVDRVSFDVRRGEIHGLVGENGAGKSTLIRVLAGDHVPDSGEIILAGRKVRFTHPREAMECGISFVHQIPMFVPNLSVTENLLLGVPFERRRAGLIDWQAENRAACEDLAKVGLSLDPRGALETLSAHERQLVAVARAVKRGPQLLVLDEVTASLSEPEVRILHARIRRLKDRGVSIIYISHRLEEIFRIADRVTVLRDGRHIVTLSVQGLTRKELARHIVGGNVDFLFDKRAKTVAVDMAVPRLSVRNLSDERLKNISFDLHPGEIVGICGLGGSGRTRLLHIIFGAKPYASGEILIDGKKHAPSDPSEALRAGIAIVTEDRIKDGFVDTLPIWQNVTLPWAHRFSRWCFLNLGEERSTSRQKAERLGVKMPAISALMTQLSGGNQQKAIFARWITGPIRILLLDEPTHGVDIRSKAEIYQIVRELAATGVAILLVTSEVEEIEGLCHRALILHRGELAGELHGEEIAKEIILHALLTGEEEGTSRHEERPYG